MHKIISKHNGERAGTRGEWHLTISPVNTPPQLKIIKILPSIAGLHPRVEQHFMERTAVKRMHAIVVLQLLNKNNMEEPASRLSNMIYHRSLGEFVRSDNRWS